MMVDQEPWVEQTNTSGQRFEAIATHKHDKRIHEKIGRRTFDSTSRQHYIGCRQWWLLWRVRAVA